MAPTATWAGEGTDARAGSDCWRRWLLGVCSATATMLLAVAAALVLFDPYDAGRLPSVLGRGVATQSPRLVRASQGRDPSFQAAVFGNSHVQLLSPTRLQAETGIAFASLTVPGSGVAEKLALIDWFLRHRREPPRALVLSVDEFECHDGPGLLQLNPFPFWLYDPSPLRHATGHFNTSALGHAVERLRLRILGQLAAPGDGYDDYEQGRAWRPWNPPPPPPPEAMPAVTVGVDAFEGWTRVKAAVAALPPQVPVVFVAPPVHVSRRPPAGSVRDQTTRLCHDAVAEFASSRPMTTFLDYRTDDPAWADEATLWDAEHVRRPTAERIERDIARVLKVP